HQVLEARPKLTGERIEVIELRGRQLRPHPLDGFLSALAQAAHDAPPFDRQLIPALTCVPCAQRNRNEPLVHQLTNDLRDRRRRTLALPGKHAWHEVLGGYLFQQTPLLLRQTDSLGQLNAPLLEKLAQPTQVCDGLVDDGCLSTLGGHG